MLGPTLALLLLLLALLLSSSGLCVALTLSPKGGMGLQFNPALFGVGDDWTLGKDTWSNATLLAGIRAVRVGLTRFPGGACSNYWNLSDANIVGPDCRNATCHGEGPWCGVQQHVSQAPPGAFSTAAFLTGPAAACSDSDVVIDLNLLHFDEHTAPALVDSVLASAGGKHNLTRWELGNEYYLPTDWPNTTKPQPYVCSPASTPGGYAARSLAVIAHIRKVVKPGSQWPGGVAWPVQVACQASLKELLYPAQGTVWNDGITSTGVAGAADAITLHDYDQRAISEVAAPFKVAALAAMGDAHIQLIARAAPKQWPQKKVWMTEFGIDVGSFDSSPLLTSLNHGGVKAMFVMGRVLAAVATEGLVEVLQYYSLGGQGWGKEAGILRWDLEGRGTLEGDAVAQVFAHAASLADEGGDTMQHAVVMGGGAPELMPWGERPPPAEFDGLPCLQAAVFTGPRSFRYIVINRCNQTMDATITSPPDVGLPMTASWTSYPCGVTNEPEPEPQPPSGFAPLPPESAPFPWPAPLVPKQGSMVSTAENWGSGGPSLSIEGLSILLVRISNSN